MTRIFMKDKKISNEQLLDQISRQGKIGNFTTWIGKLLERELAFSKAINVEQFSQMLTKIILK